MSQWKRLLYYILINIFVSACTTITVLLIWNGFASPPPESAKVNIEQSRQPDTNTPTSIPKSSLSLTTNEASNPTAEPTMIGSINITNIIGAGNVADEYVVIKGVGEGELSLEGWSLQDSSHNAYSFPTLTIFKDGIVQVHSKAGVDTVTDLYWGRDKPVWEIGEIATILDDQGEVRATYRIP